MILNCLLKCFVKVRKFVCLLFGAGRKTCRAQQNWKLKIPTHQGLSSPGYQDNVVDFFPSVVSVLRYGQYPGVRKTTHWQYITTTHWWYINHLLLNTYLSYSHDNLNRIDFDPYVFSYNITFTKITLLFRWPSSHRHCLIRVPQSEDIVILVPPPPNHDK